MLVCLLGRDDLISGHVNPYVRKVVSIRNIIKIIIIDPFGRRFESRTFMYTELGRKVNEPF